MIKSLVISNKLYLITVYSSEAKNPVKSDCILLNISTNIYKTK